MLEKLKQVELDLAANKRWSSCSQALNWLSKNHNHGKKGLGFVNEHTIYPINRKYVGLPENIVCFHCGKTGHYRYACSLRKYAMERDSTHVKQIWVRKDEFCMSKRMVPKWIWVPKQNPNLFCRHKWERTTLQTGQQTVLEPEQGTISSSLLTVGVLGT